MSTGRFSSPFLLIVKYGGSAITKKSTFETIKSDVLAATAAQVQAIMSHNSHVRVVIIHGAGYCDCDIYLQ